eukprot:scaffold4364_cov119-Isochrysis_galbana.AAC.6
MEGQGARAGVTHSPYVPLLEIHLSMSIVKMSRTRKQASKNGKRVCVKGGWEGKPLAHMVIGIPRRTAAFCAMCPVHAPDGQARPVCERAEARESLSWGLHR